MREWFDPRAPTLLAGTAVHLYDFAAYLRDHAAPSLVIGAHWGGIVPYFSELPAVDVLGKSDRHIARLEVERFDPGHAKWDWDYVLNKRRPDLFLTATRGLQQRPDFLAAYALAQREGDEAAFFVRRDALGKLHDEEIAFYDAASGERIASPPRAEWLP